MTQFTRLYGQNRKCLLNGLVSKQITCPVNSCSAAEVWILCKVVCNLIADEKFKHSNNIGPRPDRTGRGRGRGHTHRQSSYPASNKTGGNSHNRAAHKAWHGPSDSASGGASATNSMASMPRDHGHLARAKTDSSPMTVFNNSRPAGGYGLNATSSVDSRHYHGRPDLQGEI